MKKIYFKILAVLAFMCVSFGARATGWPANYQGVRVDNPGPGLYIMVQGRKAVKVILN